MKTTSMNDLNRLLSQGLPAQHVVLDVREVEEFRDGHLPQSRNYPLSTLEQKLPELRQFQTIYVHCQAGGRAQRAAALLIANGFTNLVCVADGGFRDWQAAGFPIEKSQ